MAGWRSVEDVDAYVLSAKLRDDIVTATERGAVLRDLRFREQLRSSCASAPSNLSEGFDLYSHGRFAYHAAVAKASLRETINHLHDGKHRRYFSPKQHETLVSLARQAWKATAGLHSYLRQSSAPGEAPAPRSRRKQKRKPEPRSFSYEIRSDDY